MPGKGVMPAEQTALTAKWRLRLYISGQTTRNLAAIQNLTELCGRLIPGEYQIEVIDVLENPDFLEREQVLALPMLVRLHPLPVRRVIGDLSDSNATAVALNLRTGRQGP